MTTSAPPPGGPLPREFRETISELARQAREEDRRSEQETRKLAQHRPISPIIKLGLVLLVVELVSMGILYSQQHRQITMKLPPPDRIHSRNDCTGVTYRTYWKIVAYIKDNNHPPARLDDLVPKYLDKVPFDPTTGKPLEYSVNGARFNVHCVGQPARK